MRLSSLARGAIRGHDDPEAVDCLPVRLPGAISRNHIHPPFYFFPLATSFTTLAISSAVSS